MSDEIKYTYSTDELDKLIEQISSGITPMMSPQLKEEVNLRRQELLRQMSEYEDDDDEEYAEALAKHNKVVEQIEENRRKSRSRNVMILELTDAEKQELEEGIEVSYVRNDPNSAYNIPEEQLAASEEEREIRRKLESLGKVYYNQTDYRNAVLIIKEAIEFSLKRDYPWMSYEESLEAFAEGKIRYTFTQLPTLFINYNTQITDPKILSGIVSGDVHLINADDEKPKKKRKRSKDEKGVDMNYSVISPEEHAFYVKQHQAGWNTPISTILKSCSTVYNRYVMPTSFKFKDQQQQQQSVAIDWSVEGTGDAYYNAEHDIHPNPISEIVGTINDANQGKLNQNLGMALREFSSKWKGAPEQQFTISTSLEDNKQAMEIESKILDMIRSANPNI